MLRCWYRAGFKYLEKHPDILQRHRIAILSPRFQSGRAKKMFDMNPYFEEKGIKIKWLIVEDILGEIHPGYKKWADTLYATPAAADNLESEKRGFEALEKGPDEYKPKS